MTTTTNPLGGLGIDQSKILANLPAQPTSYGGYQVWNRPTTNGWWDSPAIHSINANVRS